MGRPAGGARERRSTRRRLRAVEHRKNRQGPRQGTIRDPATAYAEVRYQRRPPALRASRERVAPPSRPIQWVRQPRPRRSPARGLTASEKPMPTEITARRSLVARTLLRRAGLASSALVAATLLACAAPREATSSSGSSASGASTTSRGATPVAMTARRAPTESAIAAALAASDDQVRRYHQIVTTLSDPFFEGRAPGTRGVEIAADMLDFYFTRIGLEPFFVDDRGSPSFRQTFDVTGPLEVVRSGAWSSRGQGALVREPISTCSGSRATPDDRRTRVRRVLHRERGGRLRDLLRYRRHQRQDRHHVPLRADGRPRQEQVGGERMVAALGPRREGRRGHEARRGGHHHDQPPGRGRSARRRTSERARHRVQPRRLGPRDRPEPRRRRPAVPRTTGRSLMDWRSRRLWRRHAHPRRR